MQSDRNGRLFWPILIAVVAADVVTKSIAVSALDVGVARDVASDWLRFTLVYNPGAAFGLHVGEHSRWVFTALTVGALVILGRLYITSQDGDRARVTSLALVCGGALGNLIDRIKSTRGVVDFLDVGVGGARWPTFNVADMAVSVGAFLLAVVLWAEERPADPVPAVVTGEFSQSSGEAT